MPATLTETPEAFPLRFDAAMERALILRLSETAYRDASFLDERIEAVAGPGEWIAWPDLEAFATGLRGEADFIFHIGHVGSTLVSRLLGQSPRVFSLREPAALRTLALNGAMRDRLGPLLRLYARTWRPGQRALVKATSFVSVLAPEIMRRQSSARALLMFIPPEPYLATILAGPASREELRANGPMRLARLHSRIGAKAWTIGEFSLGALAAMAWTAEVCALADAAASAPGRVMWLDFEDFLARPELGLETGLRHLHGAAPPDVLAAMLASSDLGRYAKATEHAYDAALRREVLNAARGEYRDEIMAGMRWLNAAGRAHPAIAEAVRAAATAPRIG